MADDSASTRRIITQVLLNEVPTVDSSAMEELVKQNASDTQMALRDFLASDLGRQNEAVTQFVTSDGAGTTHPGWLLRTGKVGNHRAKISYQGASPTETDRKLFEMLYITYFRLWSPGGVHRGALSGHQVAYIMVLCLVTRWRTS